MTDSFRLLFVCAGNICRSPMAEAMFRRIAERRPGLTHVDVGSAGTIAVEGGKPVASAVAALKEICALDMSAHRARPVTSSMQPDLILTMDVVVTQEVKGLGLGARIEPFGDYAGFPGETVHDPYGGSEEDYQRCAVQISRLVEKAAERLGQELDQEETVGR